MFYVQCAAPPRLYFKSDLMHNHRTDSIFIHLLQMFWMIDLIVNIWHHLQGAAQ